MQLSANQVFIFVEGRDLDPDVYSRICSPLCRAVGKSDEIVIADRIAGAGGGKGVLTRFFEFLENNASLVDRSQPNTKLAMFYLDKDVDEMFRRLRSSPHVVYTHHYSIENHLFAQGDLISSLAIAGSIDIELLRLRITDPRSWRAGAAQSWVDWVALCLVAAKLHMAHPVSYALRASEINTPVDSPVDQTALTALVATMQVRSGLGAVAFQRKLSAAYRLVNTVYGRREHDTLFKGKWYVAFAIRALELTATIFNRNGAADRLFGALIATVNFDGAWVEHFRQPLRDALASM